MLAGSLRPMLNELSYTAGRGTLPGELYFLGHPVGINKMIPCRQGQGQCDLNSPPVKALCFLQTVMCQVDN